EPWPRLRAESSGIVCIRKPGATHNEVLRDLGAAGVVARSHRDFVRLSPHFYNTEEEIDRVLEVLAFEGATPVANSLGHRRAAGLPRRPGRPARPGAGADGEGSPQREHPDRR